MGTVFPVAPIAQETVAIWLCSADTIAPTCLTTFFSDIFSWLLHYRTRIFIDIPDHIWRQPMTLNIYIVIKSVPRLNMSIEVGCTPQRAGLRYSQWNVSMSLKMLQPIFACNFILCPWLWKLQSNSIRKCQTPNFYWTQSKVEFWLLRNVPAYLWLENSNYENIHTALFSLSWNLVED